MNLPKITNKQKEILDLIYSYRFLNRVQIQKLMNHKDKKRIIAWLKDLREKNYITWVYSDHYLERTKPAIYFLGTNGIRYLKTTGNYPLEELRKRYYENKRSISFISHSILIADCAINLKQKTSPRLKYEAYSQAQYMDPSCDYHFLAEHEVLRPDLCIIKKDQETTTSCLLEIFDSTLPRYRLKYRLKHYVNYLIFSEWLDNTNDKQSPIILLVVPRLTDLIYAKRRVKKLLTDEFYDEIPEDLHIRFTIQIKLQVHGIAGRIWEEGRQTFSL